MSHTKTNRQANALGGRAQVQRGVARTEVPTTWGTQCRHEGRAYETFGCERTSGPVNDRQRTRLTTPEWTR